MNRHREKAVTLIELLIAALLLSMIIVGFASVDIFSRNQVLRSSRITQLQNEASFVMDHMTKFVSNAIGDINNVPVHFYTDNRGFRVRYDSNGDGKADGTDAWVAYRHVPNAAGTDSEIRFYSSVADVDPIPSSAGYTVLANKIKLSTGAAASSWGMAVVYSPNNNYIEVTIRACWTPDAVDGSTDECGTINNPMVTVKSLLKMASVSAR
jgi:Tfp pilus assembly protein PilV